MGSGVERVLHIWVDPYFGDDALAGGASALNPNGSLSFSWCTPVVPHRPNQVFNSTGSVLLHAPHPFKTISAAVDYVVATNPAGGAPLPWFGGAEGIDWQHAIIHLMPGLYQARTSTSPQAFGDPANGEHFPIHLPPNVSVQGASALNTQLVVTAEHSPAFEFGVNHSFPVAQNPIAITGENSFIDGVTITGGVEHVSELAAPAALCGVWVAGEVASRPTITNCIFHGLWVGVGVGASLDPGVEHDGLTLANNTFAWNHIGLWNGVDAPPDPQGTVYPGRSQVNVLNCLFDATPAAGLCAPPYGQQIRNGSLCFEGVSQEDMRVLIGGAYHDTNAWENGKENSGVPVLSQLPPVRPRQTDPASPRVDLSAVTGAQGLATPLAVRGVLFVRDLLCRSPFALSTGQGRSPHDFRLCPNVALADTSLEQPLTSLNPLIDAGFDAHGFVAGPLVFENGNQLESPPGALPLAGEAQATWAFHGWEFDLEGYGNPRIADHPVYASPGFGGVAAGTAIDIGADELGQLLVAGYVDRTTELRHDATGSRSEHDLAWLLGPITTQTFDLLAPMYASSASNPAWPYTTYQGPGTWCTGEARRDIDQVPLPTPPQPAQPVSVIYPASVADVTPHLLPDPHPWWNFAWNVSSPAGVPPALTLWESCLGANHNAALYLDPSSGRINPPGAAEGTAVGFDWLDGRTYFGALSGVFPFGYWSNFDEISHFDADCRAVDSTNSTNVVVLPSTAVSSSPGVHPSTLRFTLEFAAAGLFPGVETGRLFDMPSNLQTFTVWIDESGN